MGGVMRRFIAIQSILLFVSLGLVGEANAETVLVRSPAVYAKGSVVRDAVKNECDLLTKVPAYIKQSGDAGDRWNVVLSADATKKSKGLVLTLQIANLGEAGNAFSGRMKSMTLTGELHRDGKLIGRFTKMRNTGGGAFGGYMGECAFFHRCAKTLGKDVITWLDAPSIE